MPLFLVYVDDQGGRWHPYTWAETQVADEPWSQPAVIRLNTGGGCVNLRSGPSTGGPVVECLPPSQWVVSASPSAG